MHLYSPQRAALNARASLIAAVVLLGVLCAGSTLVTPLYPLYQREFGLSDLMITPSPRSLPSRCWDSMQRFYPTCSRTACISIVPR